jgi:hypothetical protein
VYEALLKLVLNPDYGDITDVESGFDLVLEYGKAPGARFPTTDISPRRKTSPMCKDVDDEECEKILDSVPDFDSLNERVSTEQVQEMLDKHLSADPEDDASETAKYGGDKEVSSVDKAFAELAK